MIEQFLKMCQGSTVVTRAVVMQANTVTIVLAQNRNRVAAIVGGLLAIDPIFSLGSLVSSTFGFALGADTDVFAMSILQDGGIVMAEMSAISVGGGTIYVVECIMR